MSIQKKLRLKLGGILVLFLVAGAVSFPGAFSFHEPTYNVLNQMKINLGLDLQGGVHLEYEADLSRVEDDQIGEAMEAAQTVIERRVNAFGVSEPLVLTAQSGDSHRVIVELPGVKDIEDAKGIIKEAPLLEFKEEIEEGNEGIQSIVSSFNEQIRTQAEDVLQRAIDGEDFGDLAREFSQDPGSRDDGGDLGFVKKSTFVSEFDEILFEQNLQDSEVYPELVETQFGYHIIKKVEERMVPIETEEESAPDTSTEGQGEESTPEEPTADIEAPTEEKEVHAQHILFLTRTIDDFPELKFSKETGLTGGNIRGAYVDFGGQQAGLGEPQVNILFDDEGKDLFAEITKRNIDKQVAIYIDNELVTAPVVQTEITDGRAVITGNYTIDEANALKKRLDEGALPVPLTLVSQQSIEASLGQADLQKSLVAGIAGLIIVIVYMILYYRLFGFVAAFALILYAFVLITVFKLTSLGGWPWPVTLTLSGIAGFILSIGMAVDANILIYERVREELKKGKSMKLAIKEGFDRAWSSIRDGNISTILTAGILVWFGTGFVKGFALILMLGVLLSLFTAVVVVRNILLALPMQKIENNLWLVMRTTKKSNDSSEK